MIEDDKILAAAERVIRLREAALRTARERQEILERTDAIARQLEAAKVEYQQLLSEYRRQSQVQEDEQSDQKAPAWDAIIAAIKEAGGTAHVDRIAEALGKVDRKKLLYALSNMKRAGIIAKPALQKRGYWIVSPNPKIVPATQNALPKVQEDLAEQIEMEEPGDQSLDDFFHDDEDGER